jgi:hypothetical protein
MANARKLSTVNVIEDVDGALYVTAFVDTPPGNKAAEALFSRVARENVRGLTSVDLEAAIEDGHLDDGGTWELYLVHSN